ncbi:MAG: Na+/H+ antiporter subunit E [Bacillota bacterium]
MRFVNLKEINRIIMRRIRPRIVIVLMIFWVVLTGEFSLGYLLTGLVLSMFITLFWGGFLLPPAPGKALLMHPGLIITIFKYFRDFIIELVQASWDVARIVLQPELPIEPVFVEYDLELDQTINRVLLANSITLTPGTLSVFLSHEHIVVHALTEEAARGVVDWEMQKYLEKFEEA